MDHKPPTKPIVVLTWEFIPEIIKAELKPYAHVVYAKTRRDLEKKIVKADGIISSIADAIDESLLARAKKLKVVSNFAVGYNNIDLKACAARGITVCNTPDVLTRATAEMALTLLTAAARRVPEGEKLCRTGNFKGWSATEYGLELKGRHAVLVGHGRIGSEFARILEGIGLSVEWITREDSPATIDEKLTRAQVLSLHCPLTPQTRHWLNAHRLSRLPKDAIVINTTRGPVVDEKALIKTLKSRRIFSAGLDVYENEPKIPKELCRLPNVVLLPHWGSATQTARHGMMRLAISGALAILSGKQAPNVVKFRP